jgi:hypothetical protein
MFDKFVYKRLHGINILSTVQTKERNILKPTQGATRT